MANEENQDITPKLREEAMNTPHIGTSVFTHQDDANAEVHPTTIEGARHLFHGEEMTPKHQLPEVVLGPAPFGSPDVRTLGHRMVPLEEGPASAPELDEDFQKLQRQTMSGNTEGNLDELKKEELLERAEALDVDVNKSATKEEIKQAIVEQQGGEEGEAPSYSGMNKSELLEEAQSRNLPVDETNSKQEIREALEADDNK